MTDLTKLTMEALHSTLLKISKRSMFLMISGSPSFLMIDKIVTLSWHNFLHPVFFAAQGSKT